MTYQPARACPFDPARAEFPTRVLPCTEVVDLIPLSHAPERIALYRGCMEQGDRFPPISVIRLFGRYLVADGHKRFAAYRQLGEPEILVEVWTLGRWLQDQWRQAVRNGRKNRRIITTSVTSPLEAWRLLQTTLLHWRRVAMSLAARAAGRVR
jgi:hypothetical protein